MNDRRSIDQLDAELEAARALLAADPVPEPARSAWPAVDAALRRREPRAGWGFRLALTAACLAGVALGIAVAPRGAAQETADRGAVPTSLWGVDTGSSLLDTYTTGGAS